MKRKLQSITSKLPAFIAFGIIILVWHIASVTESVPSYMLPAPKEVMMALIEDMDLIIMHLEITLKEAFYGLGLGVSIAFIMATFMDGFNMLYKATYPIMVITQTIPTVAIAPLLVLWMGFGMEPKITLVALTTFFPVAVGLLDGYRSVDTDQINLLKSMGAGKRKIFWHVKLPTAMPYFFSGLKISASYAIVGAVIAEWVGGLEGLGVYMTRVKKAYAFDRMFAIIIVIVLISLLLVGLVNIIRKLVMPWEQVEKSNE